MTDRAPPTKPNGAAYRSSTICSTPPSGPPGSDEPDPATLELARRIQVSEERCGRFTSAKLDRTVEFESQLERSFLREIPDRAGSPNSAARRCT